MILATSKVKVFATNDRGSLLLIREQPARYAYPRWNIISGIVDRDLDGNTGQAIFNAATREAREEAGITLSRPRLLGLYIAHHEGIVDPSRQEEVIANFVVRGTSEAQPQLPSAGEQASRSEHIVEAAWHTPEAIQALSPTEVAGSLALRMMQDFLVDTQDMPAFYVRTIL